MEIKIDLSDVERLADDLGVARDQIPFAFARVANDAAFITRGVLTKETWPQHVNAKNPNFPSAVLHVERATKENLHVELNEIDVKSQSLKDHAEGGVRRPVSAKHIAVPLSWFKALHQTQSGKMGRAYSPLALGRKKRGVVVTSKGIYVVSGGRLRMAYIFKPQTTVKADVPFEEDWARTMQYVIDRELEPALLMAMRTRFS